MVFTADSIYLTSDTHFGHVKIIEMGHRPVNYQELFFASFKELPADAVLVHLGDVCLGDASALHEKYIKPLACKKILVRGNHDSGKSDMWYMNHGWDFVCRTYSTKYFGKKILFSHEPRAWDGKFDFNIHGHFHNGEHAKDYPEYVGICTEKHLLVSSEKLNYQPVQLRKFLNC